MPGWPTVGRTDDQQLVETLRRADTTAPASLYDSYAERLNDYAHSLLGDRQAAAGAVHDALVTAQGRVDRLREPGRLRAWLYALVRIRCADGERGPRAAPSLDDPDVPDDPVERELAALVHETMAELSEREREVLELSLRHDLGSGEVGAVLGMTSRQVTARLGRARDHLENAAAAVVLAKVGRAHCPDLSAMVDSWEGPLTTILRRRLSAHIGRCEVCVERRDRHVSAGRLLGLVPRAHPPLSLRRRVIETCVNPELREERAAIVAECDHFDRAGFPAAEQRPKGRRRPGRKGSADRRARGEKDPRAEAVTSLKGVDSRHSRPFTILPSGAGEWLTENGPRYPEPQAGYSETGPFPPQRETAYPEHQSPRREVGGEYRQIGQDHPEIGLHDMQNGVPQRQAGAAARYVMPPSADDAPGGARPPADAEARHSTPPADEGTRTTRMPPVRRRRRRGRGGPVLLLAAVCVLAATGAVIAVRGQDVALGAAPEAEPSLITLEPAPEPTSDPPPEDPETEPTPTPRKSPRKDLPVARPTPTRGPSTEPPRATGTTRATPPPPAGRLTVSCPSNIGEGAGQIRLTARDATVSWSATTSGGLAVHPARGRLRAGTRIVIWVTANDPSESGAGRVAFRSAGGNARCAISWENTGSDAPAPSVDPTPDPTPTPSAAATSEEETG